MKPLINAKTECYLSPMAQEAVDAMVEAQGMDRDLAIGVLEQLWPETAIYQLEDEEEDCG